MNDDGTAEIDVNLQDGTVMNVNNVITHRHVTKSKVPKYQTMRRQRVVPATLRKRDQRMVLKALKVLQRGFFTSGAGDKFRSPLARWSGRRI
jgi:hypothetical protein